MADPRFFATIEPVPLRHIAAHLGIELPPGDHGGRMIRAVAPLETAEGTDLSFIDNRKYLEAFSRTRAGAVIAAANVAERAPAHAVVLVSPQPYRDYARAAALLHPEVPAIPGIHGSAIIDPTAVLGAGVHVGPHAVIGAAAEIGPGVAIGPNVVIGSGVVIGEGTEIGANASLSHCLIGRHVLIHPGVRIGTRGFGFALSESGFVKVPQLCRVIVGDNVEIGANTTIDRGAGPDTVIGSGTMIDNLVQIGHNVRIGRGCVLVAQSGIAGSTVLADFVMVGAQGGVAGHLQIGSRGRIAAQAGVMRDVGPGETVGGSPAVPQREWLKQSAWLNRQANRKDQRER